MHRWHKFGNGRSRPPSNFGVASSFWVLSAGADDQNIIMDGDLPPQLSHRSVSERLHFPRPHDGATTPVFDAWVAGDLEPPPIPDSGAKMKGEAVEPPPHIEQRRVMRARKQLVT